MKTGIVYHSNYLKHETGSHPERKERLIAVMNLLEAKNVLKKIANITPRSASVDEIALIHDREYIDNIKILCETGGGRLDIDTVISPYSYEVALLAAGGILSALNAVLDGNVNNAFALVRPPGHHAERNQGMGFCLFNNVAIGARYLQQKHKIKRVLIVDWDLHHGNGTQNAFYSDPSVLYFSTHQSPAYPGTGMIQEVGSGEGEGYTVNVPLSPGKGDSDYLYVFEEILIPIARQFNPEFILISAGQDIHFDDPLGSMFVTARGFEKLATAIKEIADETCRGRLVAALEGGYSLTGLSYGVLAILNAIGELNLELQEPLHKPEDKLAEDTKKRVNEVKEIQNSYWKL
ncbi:MAG: histone deacetylase [Methanocellales archaeon]